MQCGRVSRAMQLHQDSDAHPGGNLHVESESIQDRASDALDQSYSCSAYCSVCHVSGV
jgi:hypothetical protein